MKRIWNGVLSVGVVVFPAWFLSTLNSRSEG